MRRRPNRCGIPALALVALEQRTDILSDASDAAVAHGLIGLSVEIPLHPLDDLNGYSGFGRGLEQRQIVQCVVLIIDHHEAGDPRMIRKPGGYLAGAPTPRLVRTDVDEGYAPMLGGKHADRVTPPARGKHDLGAGAIQQLFEASQQLLVDDVGEFARIGRLVAIEDAVDVQKNDLHSGVSDRFTPDGRALGEPATRARLYIRAGKVVDIIRTCA